FPGHRARRNLQRQVASVSRAGTAERGIHSGASGFGIAVHLLREVLCMPYDTMELGHRLITLMAAAMLVVQMLLAGQRLLPTVIPFFRFPSFSLACLAAAVAYVNHAPHVYIAAALTLLLKVIVMPLLLQRIIRQPRPKVEVEGYLNTPASILICGGLT